MHADLPVSLPLVGSLDDDTLIGYYAPPRTPWLRVNFVTSIDGAVEVSGRSSPLSDPDDQRMLQLLRTPCDALLVGAGTIRVEGYGPPLLAESRRRWRLNHRLPEHLQLVVVSHTLALDPDLPVFTQARRPVVLTHAGAPAARREALAERAEVLTVGEHEVDLAAGLSLLHARGLRHLLCEGGPRLFGSLVAADLVDEVCLTVSPLLAGAGAGRIVAGPTSPVRDMSLRHVLAAGDTLFLRYQRRSEPLTDHR
ncbi:MAG TPA: pyrimidine reductase family protein [Natronosporangium sp.]|nr:pyrimidine reductase family protein [Natronosporangium sp.]